MNLKYILAAAFASVLNIATANAAPSPADGSVLAVPAGAVGKRGGAEIAGFQASTAGRAKPLAEERAQHSHHPVGRRRLRSG